jgi:hypothetical protein
MMLNPKQRERLAHIYPMELSVYRANSDQKTLTAILTSGQVPIKTRGSLPRFLTVDVVSTIPHTSVNQRSSTLRKS